MSVVVSDTSPLHYLIQCEAVGILPVLFAEVLIPPAVFQELQHPNTPPAVRVWAQAMPSWLHLRAPVEIDPTLDVDEGERQAICLAREAHASAILIDDRKGRAAAVRLGLRVTGTIGLLETAANRGLVDLQKALKLLQQTNARIDPELIQTALQRSHPLKPKPGREP